MTDARDNFVCGQIGRGKTTRLINWWQQAVAEVDEELVWIDPKTED